MPVMRVVLEELAALLVKKLLGGLVVLANKLLPAVLLGLMF